MAAVPPRFERRRPRPGSLERPVNGRLYRGTWLIVGLPLLVAAFSVARPTALPPPLVPSVFDARAATGLATELSVNYPDRFPGTVGAQQAVSWFREQLAPYRIETHVEPFTATVPGLGRLHLRNVVARIPGRSPDTIVVMAHRDDEGTGPGANDNASGTAALVQLARAYSVPRTAPSAHLIPAHTILFLSTDGGAFGGLGAAQFVAQAPERRDVVAVINLDAIAGSGRPRLDAGGDTPRTTSATLLETAVARIAKQYGLGPSRSSVLRQLIDLGFPFSLYEQAPFISREIPAVTITTAGDRPPAAARAGFPELPQPSRFLDLGRRCLRAVRARRTVAGRGGPAALAGHTCGAPLAACRHLAALGFRTGWLVCRARPSPAPTADHCHRRTRRPNRCAPLPRRSRTPRRRHESVCAVVRTAAAARVALV